MPPKTANLPSVNKRGDEEAYVLSKRKSPRMLVNEIHSLKSELASHGIRSVVWQYQAAENTGRIAKVQYLGRFKREITNINNIDENIVFETALHVIAETVGNWRQGLGCSGTIRWHLKDEFEVQHISHLPKSTQHLLSVSSGEMISAFFDHNFPIDELSHHDEIEAPFTFQNSDIWMRPPASISGSERRQLTQNDATKIQDIARRLARLSMQTLPRHDILEASGTLKLKHPYDAEIQIDLITRDTSTIKRVYKLPEYTPDPQNTSEDTPVSAK